MDVDLDVDVEGVIQRAEPLGGCSCCSVCCLASGRVRKVMGVANEGEKPGFADAGLGGMSHGARLFGAWGMGADGSEWVWSAEGAM